MNETLVGTPTYRNVDAALSSAITTIDAAVATSAVATNHTQ